MNVTEIATLVLKITAFILVVIVVPLIKKKYDKNQLEDINEKIMTYVRAAEQIFGSEQGAEKKQWVRGRLAGWGIDVDLDYIDAQVEAAVLLLHAALKSE